MKSIDHITHMCNMAMAVKDLHVNLSTMPFKNTYLFGQKTYYESDIILGKENLQKLLIFFW